MNGKCGIVLLTRKVSANSIDLDIVDHIEEVESEEHIDLPETIDNIVNNIIVQEYIYSSHDDFIHHLKVTVEQRDLLENVTRNQANNELCFLHRKDRIHYCFNLQDSC